MKRFDYSVSPSPNPLDGCCADGLFPLAAGHILIREAYEDTVLQIPNPPGQDGTTALPVPKGMQVIVDMIGVRTYPNNRHTKMPCG